MAVAQGNGVFAHGCERRNVICGMSASWLSSGSRMTREVPGHFAKYEGSQYSPSVLPSSWVGVTSTPRSPSNVPRSMPA